MSNLDFKTVLKGTEGRLYRLVKNDCSTCQYTNDQACGKNSCFDPIVKEITMDDIMGKTDVKVAIHTKTLRDVMLLRNFYLYQSPWNGDKIFEGFLMLENRAVYRLKKEANDYLLTYNDLTAYLKDPCIVLTMDAIMKNPGCPKIHISYSDINDEVIKYIRKKLKATCWGDMDIKKTLMENNFDEHAAIKYLNDKVPVYKLTETYAAARPNPAKVYEVTRSNLRKALRDKTSFVVCVKDLKEFEEIMGVIRDEGVAFCGNECIRGCGSGSSVTPIYFILETYFDKYGQGFMSKEAFDSKRIYFPEYKIESDTLELITVKLLKYPFAGQLLTCADDVDDMGFADLTIGKQYKVKAVENRSVMVTNDKGTDAWYFQAQFKEFRNTFPEAEENNGVCAAHHITVTETITEVGEGEKSVKTVTRADNSDKPVPALDEEFVMKKHFLITVEVGNIFANFCLDAIAFPSHKSIIEEAGKWVQTGDDDDITPWVTILFIKELSDPEYKAFMSENNNDQKKI